MGEAGLEPARHKSLVSKTNAATNYAIPPYGGADGNRTHVQKLITNHKSHSYFTSFAYPRSILILVP